MHVMLAPHYRDGHSVADKSASQPQAQLPTRCSIAGILPHVP